MPQTRVYTHSKSLDTNSYLDACHKEEKKISPVKVNNHELKDFEFRNDTLRKIIESFKGQKICLYPAVNMLCGAILPLEHTCRRMGKVKESFRSPCKLLVPGAKCLAGIGEQPHYCAQYAPTDPKHPWNEGAMFVCKRCNQVHGNDLPCHIAMDTQAMNYQNWSYICEITGKTRIPLYLNWGQKINLKCMKTNDKVSLIKTGKANKPLKQENKRENQSRNQKCKVPEISAPKIFPMHPLPPTPLEMKQMTKIPRYWSQSRESLLDRAYEEISEKFLEGAFHPDGHKEIFKEPELNTGVQVGNQNKITNDAKIYIEGIENKDPKVLEKAQAFAESLNDQLAPLNEAIKALMLNDKNPSEEYMQIDPAIEANIELQLSREEFEKFMEIPVGNDKIKKTETPNPDQSKQRKETPKSPQHDECMPNLISQERMEIEPCYRKDNSMIENDCFGSKKENKVDCTHRLDLNSPLNYALVPEHIANHVVAVQVPLLNIYSMELEVEVFSQVNHFRYVPFSNEKLLKLKKTTFRKFGMCPMSYHLNDECVLLNHKKYLWCQHGYMDHPAYNLPLGYSFISLPIVGDPERVKREMELRNSQGSMKNLLNSPDINCETCESFNSTCKDKMILDGYIWCIHGLTNKPGQPANHKEVLSWKTEIIKAEIALNRQPMRETVIPNFTLFEQLEPQTYRICKHNFVNGRNPKNNLIQVCPIGKCTL